MAIRAEHEIHGRRKSRNVGVGLALLGFVALMFALSVVKITSLGGAIEGFDHVARPALAVEASE
ncbi:hypothetical protein AIOL_004522 [Candidatus Rhodobacter oscarellae]|uniref:Cytochrome C oxidase assembly protein n=1 Tax=Candidatus Rhodobacter oscarellae TaxID=1675527 RepID=A0A0J9E9S8_9RHOB|nr:hypothetical protein [Candidatus Rhodobacter lobularis]KMW59540.1 hypothetical protein AIOL_004522 [Candidatus Rhodobacter lobularis]